MSHPSPSPLSPLPTPCSAVSLTCINLYGGLLTAARSDRHSTRQLHCPEGACSTAPTLHSINQVSINNSSSGNVKITFDAIMVLTRLLPHFPTSSCVIRGLLSASFQMNRSSPDSDEVSEDPPSHNPSPERLADCVDGPSLNLLATAERQASDATGGEGVEGCCLTWKQRAQRWGEDGYRIGDLTRGLFSLGSAAWEGVISSEVPRLAPLPTPAPTPSPNPCRAWRHCSSSSERRVECRR